MSAVKGTFLREKEKFGIKGEHIFGARQEGLLCT